MELAFVVTAPLAALGALARWLLPLGAAAGVPATALGLAALTVGTRWHRPLAIGGGGAVGALAGVALSRFLAFHFGLPPWVTIAVLTAAFAAGVGAVPRAFPFAAAALPGALIGWQVPLAGSALLGAGAAALLLGLAGLAFGSFVSAAFASLWGAVLVIVGILAAFGSVPFAVELGGRPAVLAGAAIVLAVAGTAFQLDANQADAA